MNKISFLIEKCSLSYLKNNQWSEILFLSSFKKLKYTKEKPHYKEKYILFMYYL